MAEIIQIFEGQEIAISSDGMWNATQMCKKFNRKVNDFFRLQQTNRYLKSLKKIHEFSDDDLVKTVKGGNNQNEQGTWVHRKVALKLAAWLNTDFEAWVYDVIEKLLVEGEVKLKDEIAGLKQALEHTEGELEISEFRLIESKSKAEYWQNEYTLYRHGSHSEYEEVGQFQEGDLQLGV
ncbi:MAG: KilA-N domain-containing protein [Microcoleaceae cyanobacterium MO_207.B10]|nr:KilA-N domain-containing protein [Microcoleaceae cyanobacterium MO_207.B10]